MKLSLLFASISLASASLVKRDHGLPYSTLPSANCSTPSTCSSITGTVTCRCSDTITVCLNTNNEYCWGSVSLNQTTCPTVPTTCSSTLTGTSTTCLCDSKNVLCVDNANNYCFGAISGSNVALTALPYAPSAAASSAIAASSTNAAAGATTNPGMSVIGAPSQTTTAAATTQTSGVDRLTATTMFTFVSVLVAYIAIN